MSECARADGKCPFATICTGRCSAEKAMARYAAADRRKTIRTCPLPIFPPEGRPANWCRWCGGEIVHGRVAQRGWHDGRADEPNCRRERELHTVKDVQLAFLIERDGQRCADCGENPERWHRRGLCSQMPQDLEAWGEAPWPRFSMVRRVSALEVDHDVPLWSVAHLPDDERRPFFGPPNLKLRCEPCHDGKTATEAGDRAKGNRQSKMRLDVPRETAAAKGRGIPQRAKPWPDRKGATKFPSRPLRSRNDLKRR